MRLCNGRCVHCGSTENLQLGHIIPHSKGGSRTVANLIIECEMCNKKKGTKFFPTKFFKLDSFKVKSKDPINRFKKYLEFLKKRGELFGK